MLPAAHRLRASRDFTDVVSRGRRAMRGSVTVHLLTSEPAAAAGPCLAGLVVGKSVGGSVVRSQVSRRLRHLLRDRMQLLAPGSKLVVRASARTASSSSAQLGIDLDAALTRVLASSAANGRSR